jgi:hypothetical protein
MGIERHVPSILLMNRLGSNGSMSSMCSPTPMYVMGQPAAATLQGRCTTAGKD